MKKKTMIVLLLCAALLTGMLAGCAKTQPAPAPTQDQTEAKTPAETKPEQTPAEEQAPAEEQTPAEEPRLPLVKDGESVTLTIGVPQSSKVEDYETNEYTLWLEEQTGINLEFVYFASTSSEYATQLSLMVAGGEKLPDILWRTLGMTSSSMYEYGEDGYFVDLAPYFESSAYYWNEAYDNITSEEGRRQIWLRDTDPSNGAIYAFPSIQVTNDNDLVKNYVAINTAWLDAVGADMPQTTQELYEVLKKFASEDPNGNGKADEMPLVCAVDVNYADALEYIIGAWVYVNDKDFFNVTDGQLWVPYTTDEYRQALIYLNKLYGEGLISPMCYTLAKNGELKPIFTPSEGPAIAGVFGGHPTLTTETDNETVFEYQPLPVLKAETPLGGYALRATPSYDELFFSYKFDNFITSDCENPELAFKLLDFMCSQESAIFQRYGRKGVHWDYAKEGATDAMGQPALFEVLDDSVYSGQNNINWHNIACTVLPYNVYAPAYVDDGSYSSRLTDLKMAYRANILSKEGPAESANGIVYSTEETKTVSELASNLSDYMEQARAMFVTGVLDPNSDADWQAYLSNMDSQGLADYLRLAQEAYSRMQ